jgi:hypothetical protein
MTKYISTFTGLQVDEAIGWIRDIFDGTDLANIGDLSMSGTLETTSTAPDSIKTAGGLSVGVTSSLWGSNYKALELPAGNLASYLNSQLQLNQNAYDDAVGAYKFKANGYANSLVCTDGVYYFKTSNASGLANGAITWLIPLNIGIDQKATFAGKIETTSTATDSIKTAGGIESAGTIKVGAYTLPATDGTNGQVLVTNGSGVLTWTTL